MGSAVIHSVYFKLKQASPAAVAALVAECHDKLDGHDGVEYFQVGERGDGFDRPVNDHDFDVALLLVFRDRAAHDSYQACERHQQFIQANKDTWAAVRVFDAIAV